MNFKELGIQTIKPLAVLKGGLNGTKFIAEATKEDGKIQLLSLIPPDYSLDRATPIESYILESAVEKHEFIPTDHGPIRTFEDYEEYLREINQTPNQGRGKQQGD